MYIAVKCFHHYLSKMLNSIYYSYTQPHCQPRMRRHFDESHEIIFICSCCSIETLHVLQQFSTHLKPMWNQLVENFIHIIQLLTAIVFIPSIEYVWSVWVFFLSSKRANSQATMNYTANDIMMNIEIPYNSNKSIQHVSSMSLHWV